MNVNVAMLGTGMIGAGMVEAWLGRGLEVHVWNRSQAKVAPLVEQGAHAHASVAEAAASAKILHLALSDDAAVDATLDAAGEALHGKLVVDHTTTSPAGARARSERLAVRGARFLHAPVFMSPAMCRSAHGIMLASGPSATFEEAKAHLSAMTGRLDYLGERPDLAAAYKLFGNTMIVTMTAGLADVYAIARSNDIDPVDALGLFSKFQPAGIFQLRGARMAEGDYTPSFELTMARKDVRLMMEAAGHQPLSALPSVAARMDALIAEGRGGLDLGALALTAVPPKPAP
jgi:3-hydroxyisobutyrate dehydrogenase-like beta-hydroxyacid dehydrogenase